MDLQTLLFLLLIFVVVLIAIVIWLGLAVRQNTPEKIESALQSQHRAMLTDLGDGLAKQGDRIAASQLDSAERIRQSVATLQVEQTKNLSDNREELIRQLAALNLEIQQKQIGRAHV